MSRGIQAAGWRSLLFGLAVALLPLSAAAQAPGRIAGTVTNQEDAPVYGAQVSVVGSRLGSLSNASGQFVLTGVPAGTHQLRVTYVGYRNALYEVTVSPGEATQVTVRLEGAPIELGGVVISAARREQRITDAPATVTHIGPDVIDNTPGNNWGGALAQAVGLDFIRIGVTGVAVNARGFNSSFNNRMLMMEDGRIAVLPENGLPVGQFTAIPKIDLAGIEVLVGPGAALYGPDASSGVVTLQSKDPRQFPGTSVEISGGNRSYKNVQARQAGLFGDWGYKVSGEWQEAHEFENRIRSSAAPTSPLEVTVGDTTGPNWESRVVRGHGALVRYMGSSRFELSAGASETDGVGQTNVGRNQLVGWQYNFQQAKLSVPNWYFNLYRAQSKAGNSYAINRYTDNRLNPANAALSDEQVRLMSDWPSNGQLYAAEVQNNFRVPALLNTSFVLGAQFRRDIVSSERQWLSDRLTGKDLNIDQKGLYGQVEIPLAPWLDAVFAGRYDDHENYDAQFSPKGGVVIKPADNQALRLTYNRAFKSPSTLQTNFYIPDWTPVVAIYGNTAGFTVRDDAGTTLASYTPLVPEENTTWEAGYKGVLAERFFVDLAAYRSRYQDFLSPLVIIANPFAAPATFAHDATGARITNQAGIAPVFLTYYNLGEATIYGTDLGLNYYVSPRLTLNGTFSWLKVDSVAVPAGREEATAINAPSTKWTAGARLTDIARISEGPVNGGVTARHVNGYYFRSGINFGVIPTFTTVDLNFGYELPVLNRPVLNVGVNNLFTCSQREDQPLEYAPTDPLRTAPTNKERECGFGKKHIEMINMPQIGTTVFVGMRYNTR